MRRSLHVGLLLAVVLGIGNSLGAQLQIREIPYESAADVLKGLPDDVYIGEAAGVATNSQGHLYRVYANRLTTAHARNRAPFSSRLRRRPVSSSSTNRASICGELGQGLYGFIFAHTVRVDAQDNIWTVDEGGGHDRQVQPAGTSPDGSRTHT